MSEGNIRHMFPGGNTSLGFFSYYNYILPQENARRIFIIKGGPGVGKSTFMKKVAQEMLDRGYKEEYMHCSSDPNSLDGLVIPKLKVALMDGTAPHVVDPKNPGVVDEIINLGDYWNEADMAQHRNNVIETNREVGSFFARAYRYIKAAASLYEDTEVINRWAMNTAAVKVKAAEVIDEVFVNISLSEREGEQRHLFASAITPEGLKNYLDSLLNMSKVYIIKGNQGSGTEILLEKVRTAAVERGLYSESYYCALKPSKLEHLIIPEANTALTTSNAYHAAGVDAYSEIDLNAVLDKKILNKYNKEIAYNKAGFERLLGKGIDTLRKAKALHDKMEAFYIPNMDFEAVQRCMDDTIARILDYAEK